MTLVRNKYRVDQKAYRKDDGKSHGKDDMLFYFCLCLLEILDVLREVLKGAKYPDDRD